MIAPMGLSFFSPANADESSDAIDFTLLAAVEAEAAEVVEAEPKVEPAVATAAKAEAPAEKSAAPAAAAQAAIPGVAALAKRFKIPVSLANQIHSAAVAEGIEPRIAFGLVHTESSFRRTVISSAGAVGYTQLLPSTAGWIAPGTTRAQLFQPHTNLRVGFKYLRYLEKKYNGNMRLALTAYNRGPGTVDRLLKQGRNPENGYATKVLRGQV
jgi:soluble lytic murein transglycosylase-like protein